MWRFFSSYVPLAHIFWLIKYYLYFDTLYYFCYLYIFLFFILLIILFLIIKRRKLLFKENELIDIEPLNRDDCIALVRECQAKGILWGIQPENSDTRFVPDERFMEFTHDQYMKSKIIPGLDPENYEKIYKVYVACYEPVEHSLETLKKLPWCRFMKEYIFVEPSDKARGIRRIVDHFGGDYRDVVVFGDHRNDLSMFTGEWTGIAMGNAVEELKAKADYVTSDIEDDGIWNACVRFGWI